MSCLLNAPALTLSKILPISPINLLTETLENLEINLKVYTCMKGDFFLRYRVSSAGPDSHTVVVLLAGLTPRNQI